MDSPSLWRGANTNLNVLVNVDDSTPLTMWAFSESRQDMVQGGFVCIELAGIVRQVPTSPFVVCAASGIRRHLWWWFSLLSNEWIHWGSTKSFLYFARYCWPAGSDWSQNQGLRSSHSSLLDTPRNFWGLECVHLIPGFSPSCVLAKAGSCHQHLEETLHCHYYKMELLQN